MIIDDRMPGMRARPLPRKGRRCSLVGGALRMGAAGGGAPSYATIVNSIGPIAYWRLGESSGINAIEQVAGRNGTYQNGPTLGVAGGNPVDSDTAVLFDPAQAQYASIPHSSIFDFTSGGVDQPFSIGAWVYKNALGTDGSILSNAASTTNLGWFFHISGTNILRLQLYSGNVAGNQIYADFDVSADVGAWQFYVGTYDGSATAAGIKLYRGNTLLGSTNGSAGTYAAMAATTSEIDIGASFLAAPTYTTYWDGILDEVMIFNKVITAAQITSLYTGVAA